MVVLWDLMGFTLWCHQSHGSGKSPNWFWGLILLGNHLFYGPWLPASHVCVAEATLWNLHFFGIPSLLPNLLAVEGLQLHTQLGFVGVIHSRQEDVVQQVEGDYQIDKEEEKRYSELVIAWLLCHGMKNQRLWFIKMMRTSTPFLRLNTPLFVG